MKRDTQLALVEGMDRPVGAILPSVIEGNNDELIAKVAPLYIRGDVVDVTYGEGMWWRRFRPENLVAHDLHKLDGVDFTALPEPDDSYDTVCFDPPYVPAGGTGANAKEYRERYGLTPRSRKQMDAMIAAGVGECARVLRPGGFLLAKCCDYVNGSQFHLGHVTMINAGEVAGLYVHDLLVHVTGSGPGGHAITTIKRARRHHSYLIVMRHEVDRWADKRRGNPNYPQGGA